MLKAMILTIKEFFIYRKYTARIITVYSSALIIVSTFFYFMIPYILNYPKGTVGGKFQMELENANYTVQYILSSLMILVSIAIYLIFRMKDFNKNIYLIEKDKLESRLKIGKIRKDCIYIPYTIFFIQILVPSILIIAVHSISTKFISLITTFKIWILFFSFITLAAVFTHMFAKRIFSKILLETYEEQEQEGKRINLRFKIFLQLIPMFILALLFTSLTGYSRMINEKGNSLFLLYREKLLSVIDHNIDNLPDLKRNLSQVNLVDTNDIPFIIKVEGTNWSLISGVDDKNTPILSPFFRKYLNELAFNNQNNGHIYDYYGVDTQGAAIKLKSNKGFWVVGVKYIVGSKETVAFFIVNFIILIALNSIILVYFSRTLTEDVSRVAMSLMEIAGGGDANINKKLPVTSNDEIGDLVIAFNKIQKREKENLESIKKNQAILLEQERLASLGQLIGGIAHNLKTPIMSLSGGIEALKELAYEYRDSIDDRSVTVEDHKEIVKDMLTWLDKMKPYCAYMSDVINAVKGQAVRMNDSSTDKFTVDELIKKVDLLMKHELKLNHCALQIESQIDMKTDIKGEVNNLVQVFDNIIINAVHAYEGKEGIINLKIMRSGDNIEFIFKDYAKGIPKAIADRLLKEMVTTKGKKGTGLGLYMSYSTIKGRFSGNMSFTSKEGIGTTFYISIPCINPGIKEVNK